MSQVQELVELLKAQIRHKGMTYRELSSDLGVSESTLKRWFSQKSFNIEKLDDLCRVLKVDLADLLSSGRGEHQTRYLTEEQELEFVADKNLFMTFYLALEGKDLKQMLKRIELGEHKVRGYLIRLDQLGLIELHAQDRIVPLVEKSIRWLAKGPLNEKYGRLIRQDFMNSTFENDFEKLWLESGYVSKSSLEVFSRKFSQLLAEFRELIRLDKNTDIAKKVNITFVAAHRPWTLPIFLEDDTEK